MYAGNRIAGSNPAPSATTYVFDITGEPFKPPTTRSPRRMKTVWILSVVAVLTVSAAFAAYAMELHRGSALWQVVRACVADYKLTGMPFPCLKVDLAGGDERGNVVLRAPLLDDTILAATRRITGIEDPFLQSPEAPKIISRRRMRARTFLQGRGRTGRPERDAVALFVNSAMVRTQDQLHIHVGCLFPYARRSLAAAAPKVPMGQWAQIGPVVPHTMFWAYRIPGTDLFECQSVSARRRSYCARQDEGPARPDGRGRGGSRGQRRWNSWMRLLRQGAARMVAGQRRRPPFGISALSAGPRRAGWRRRPSASNEWRRRPAVEQLGCDRRNCMVRCWRCPDT